MIFFNALDTSKKSRIVLFAASLFLFFWTSTRLFNVYRSAFAGAVFECMFLPMLAALICLPVICLVCLIRVKCSFRSFHLYSLIVLITTMILLFLSVL